MGKNDFPSSFAQESLDVLSFLKGIKDKAEREYLSAKENHRKSTVLNSQFNVDNDTLIAMDRLCRDRDTMPAVWAEAENVFGELYLRLITLDIRDIYTGVHHRPTIRRKERDRDIDSVISAIKGLQKYSALSDIEEVFSRALSSKFQPKRKLFYSGRKPKDIYQAISFNSTVKVWKDLLDLEPEIKSRDFKRLNSALKKIKQYSDPSGNELGSFLEQAFSAIARPYFSPKGSMFPDDKLGQQPFITFSFNKVMEELIFETQKLKAAKIFYPSRNVTHDLSKKNDIIIGYSKLIEKIYKRKNDNITASVLMIAEPEKLAGLTYAEIATIRNRRHKSGTY